MNDTLLPWSTIKEMRELGFRFREMPSRENRLPTVEQIVAQMEGPVSMARWSDGSGFSAFDADFGEEYPHRADGSTLKEALVRLWLMKHRAIDSAFTHI